MRMPPAAPLVWTGTRTQARAYLQDLMRRMAAGQVTSCEHRKAVLAAICLANRIPRYRASPIWPEVVRRQTAEASEWLERVRQGFAVVYAHERAQRQAGSADQREIVERETSPAVPRSTQ